MISIFPVTHQLCQVFGLLASRRGAWPLIEKIPKLTPGVRKHAVKPTEEICAFTYKTLDTMFSRLMFCPLVMQNLLPLHVMETLGTFTQECWLTVKWCKKKEEKKKKRKKSHNTFTDLQSFNSKALNSTFPRLSAKTLTADRTCK